MSAYNVVRFRVKPGREKAFLDAHERMRPEFDSIRDTLEDLGHGLGVTDPVSGPVVVDIAG